MSRTTHWLDNADITRAVERLRRRGEGVLAAAKRPRATKRIDALFADGN